jgi:hypothetical protein
MVAFGFDHIFEGTIQIQIQKLWWVVEYFMLFYKKMEPN